MFYLTNGDIVPCCADYNSKLKIGNLKTERNIKKILNSQQIKNLRTLHNKHKFIGICKYCVQYDNSSIFKRNQSSII